MLRRGLCTMRPLFISNPRATPLPQQQEEVSKATNGLSTQRSVRAPGKEVTFTRTAMLCTKFPRVRVVHAYHRSTACHCRWNHFCFESTRSNLWSFAYKWADADFCTIHKGGCYLCTSMFITILQQKCPNLLSSIKFWSPKIS